MKNLLVSGLAIVVCVLGALSARAQSGPRIVMHCNGATISYTVRRQFHEFQTNRDYVDDETGSMNVSVDAMLPPLYPSVQNGSSFQFTATGLSGGTFTLDRAAHLVRDFTLYYNEQHINSVPYPDGFERYALHFADLPYHGDDTVDLSVKEQPATFTDTIVRGYANSQYTYSGQKMDNGNVTVNLSLHVENMAAAGVAMADASPELLRISRTQGAWRAEFPEAASARSLVLTDILGKRVCSVDVSAGERSLLFSQRLTAGCYFARLSSSASQACAVAKVVVME